MTVYIVGLLYRTIWLGGLMFWATFVSHCVGRFYFRPLHPSAWAKAKIVNYVIQHEEMLNQKKKKKHEEMQASVLQPCKCNTWFDKRKDNFIGSYFLAAAGTSWELLLAMADHQPLGFFLRLFSCLSQ